MMNRDYTRRNAAKLSKVTRRAARAHKAARQLAFMAFGQDDAAVMGSR